MGTICLLKIVPTSILARLAKIRLTKKEPKSQIAVVNTLKIRQTSSFAVVVQRFHEPKSKHSTELYESVSSAYVNHLDLGWKHNRRETGSWSCIPVFLNLFTLVRCACNSAPIFNPIPQKGLGRYQKQPFVHYGFGLCRLRLLQQYDVSIAELYHGN